MSDSTFGTFGEFGLYAGVSGGNLDVYVNFPKDVPGADIKPMVTAMCALASQLLALETDRQSTAAGAPSLPTNLPSPAEGETK